MHIAGEFPGNSRHKRIVSVLCLNYHNTSTNVFVVSVIVLSNCHILQFLHQMFNVSALLLDDALLKCVVTEVVLFSIVAFKTLTFHNVVERHSWGVVGSSVIVLLPMFSWFWQWSKFENRPIGLFYEINTYKTKCASFLYILYVYICTYMYALKIVNEAIDFSSIVITELSKKHYKPMFVLNILCVTKFLTIICCVCKLLVLVTRLIWRHVVGGWTAFPRSPCTSSKDNFFWVLTWLGWVADCC